MGLQGEYRKIVYVCMYIYISPTWQFAAMVHDNDAIQTVLKGNLVSILH